MPGISELAMDLVGNDKHAILETDPADAFELLPRPYPTCRIMRIAQQHHRRLRIRRLALQVLPVDGISIVLVNQTVAKLPAPIVPDSGKERIIARRLHDHIIPGPRKRLDTSRISRNDTRRRNDMLPGDTLPPMPPVKPVAHRIIIRLRHQLIPEHPMLQPLPQRLQNRRRSLIIHIRHPQRQRILLEQIPLYARGIPARNYLIEIVNFHASKSLVLGNSFQTYATLGL